MANRDLGQLLPQHCVFTQLRPHNADRWCERLLGVSVRRALNWNHWLLLKVLDWWNMPSSQLFFFVCSSVKVVPVGIGLLFLDI